MAEQNGDYTLGNHSYSIETGMKWSPGGYDAFMEMMLPPMRRFSGGPKDGDWERSHEQERTFPCYERMPGIFCGAKVHVCKQVGQHVYHYNPTTNTYQYKGVRK